MRKMWSEWYVETCQGGNPTLLLCVCETCRGVQKKACGKSGQKAPSFLEEVLGNSQRERAEEGKFGRDNTNNSEVAAN